MKAVYSLFERWVDPFHEPDSLRPPSTTLAFLWHYARQAKWPIAASLVIGGLLPLVEAGLFYFTGRLVDILDEAGRNNVERSWSAFPCGGAGTSFHGHYGSGNPPCRHGD